MAKTSDAQLKAIKKYNSNSKYISIKYTPNQISDYERVTTYCSNNGLALQAYIKSLIKADLDSKGVSYIDAGDGSKAKTGS